MVFSYGMNGYCVVEKEKNSVCTIRTKHVGLVLRPPTMLNRFYYKSDKICSINFGKRYVLFPFLSDVSTHSRFAADVTGGLNLLVNLVGGIALLTGHLLVLIQQPVN